MIKWTVYKWTCISTQLSYVGITSRTPKKRAGSGMYGYSYNEQMWQDIEIYGVDDWECEILHDGIETIEDAIEFEKIFIELYDTYRNGYNQSPGGGFPKRMSEETKRKISRKLKGWKKKKCSYETRLKMSKSSRKIRVDPDTVMKYGGVLWELS